jgi:translation initiation factor 6 (eIF-6)
MATKEKRTIENDEYVAMMQRMIRSLERRAINDPSMLAQVLLLVQQLNEVTNVVIAESADAYAIDPFKAPSMMEIARMLGIKKQSASDRRKVGQRILAGRLAAAGLGNFTQARRERAARKAAAQHAAETMPEYTARHLRAVS